MGNALIVMTVPEEALASTSLYDIGEDGSEFRLAERYGSQMWKVRRHLAEKHPKAYYRMTVRAADIWDLPHEPSRTHGLDWHKKPSLRQAHRRAVKRSLEDFLNGRLRRLRHMVRTGWWILGDVRVRVAVCKPVPEYEMKPFAKSMAALGAKLRAGRASEAKSTPAKAKRSRRHR
jgi:hypothetical protein